MNAAIPDIGAAAEAVASASEVTAAAARQLAGSEGGVDANQVVAYDLAHASAALECARAAVEYGGRGQVEGRLAAAFVADAAHDAAGRVLGRAAAWGTGVLPTVDARAPHRRARTGRVGNYVATSGEFLVAAVNAELDVSREPSSAAG